jgi:hypothetical protein
MTSQNDKIRWGWIKGMYIYTIVGAGGFGLGIIVLPDVMRSVFSWPTQDPIVYGVTGSVYVAFGILSILGLRSPLKFAPVLLLQLCYKVVWFIGVILPLVAGAKFPAYAILHVIIFATYVIGDLIAIPFSHVFAKSEQRQTSLGSGLLRAVGNPRPGKRMIPRRSELLDHAAPLREDYQKNRLKVFEGWVAKDIGEILLSVDHGHLLEAEEWIRKAVEADSRNEMRWHLGRDYALYAELCKRKGEPLKAKENLDTALEIFNECGADGWVKKYEQELAYLS